MKNKTTKTKWYIWYPRLFGVFMIVALIAIMALIGFLLPEKPSAQAIPKEKLLITKVEEALFNKDMDLISVKCFNGFHRCVLISYVVEKLPLISVGTIENADMAFIRLETSFGETLAFDPNGNAYKVISDEAFANIPETDCIKVAAAANR